jgi:hypothetical protein
MEETIHKKYFPMKMPLGVVGRSMDQGAAQKFTIAINHLVFPPDYKQSVGLFGISKVTLPQELI